MSETRISRRTALRIGGSIMAGGILAQGGCDRPSGPAAPQRDPEPGGNTNSASQSPLRVIDVHFHAVRSNLPDVLGQPTGNETPFDGSLEQYAQTVRAELKRANIEHALCMPRREIGKTDPLGVEDTRRLAKLIPALHPIALADPERADEEHLARVEESLAQGDVVAFKAYLGYLHFPPDHPGYLPYYRLAAKHKIPVIFHTGDTWSHVARLKYAHPLPLDDLAVDFPETNFVLAHAGNPWLLDAAELIYKNNKPGFRENVWADLSGLLVGTAEVFANYRREGVLKSVIHDVRKALEFAERPDRFLFGSDWPLAPIDVYLDFIRDLVPAQHHQLVFHDNAAALFKLSNSPSPSGRGTG